MRPRHARPVRLAASVVAPAACRRPAEPPPAGMILVASGAFIMATDEGMGFGGPPHRARVGAFYLDTHEVTDRALRAFAESTSYVREADRLG